MSRPGLYVNRGVPWQRPDGRIIGKGEEFVPTEEERLRKAYKLQHIGPAPEPAPEPVDAPAEEEYPRDVGGGWFQLPDGRKVQGEVAAREAMTEGGD